MFVFLYDNLKKGLNKITNNPQLIYTIIVAVLIIGSFVFVSERFIGIANDAQERLVNVRVGSLQDAFVSFAQDKIDDHEYLNQKIQDIIVTNETINRFKIVKKNIVLDSVTGKYDTFYEVVASNHVDEIGTHDSTVSFLFSLAASDPSHSVTISLQENNERLFKTTRAITNARGDVVGAVVTTQTLSIADLAIANDIRSSRILLVVILILIILLFLRHSRIIDYVELYKKLKEIDQLKDDFVSMASHELRTPLSIIRGYVEFISSAPELSTQTKNFASKIDIATKDLDNLVSDILDVSRIEQGRMLLKIEKIDPIHFVEEIVSSFEISAKEKNLAVSLDKTNIINTVYINVDLGHFKQILINIIGNAIKYTTKGGIVVKEYVENDRFYIRVIDTGFGMSEEEKNKLFSKFYRIQNEETKNIRGTGLGLWITAQMTKQMYGTISVESIKGVGSHFIISFPVIK